MTQQYKVQYNTEQCLFRVTSNCDSQDSAIESAKDMFQYVLKRACMGSSKWQRSLWREYIVLSHGLLWHI